MKTLPALLLTSALLLCAALPACSQASSGAEVQTQGPTHMQAVDETLKVQTQVIASGLKAPWNLAELPNGDLLVTEKLAGLRRVNATGQSAEITGTPPAFFKGQAGYFDILLAPDFETSAIVYLSYARGTSKANATAIFKARLDGDALVDGEDIFIAGPTKDTGSHFGGRMSFMPDGTLILTTGDGFSYREQAQNRESHLGKILRLTPNGKAAGGNPFAGEPSARHEVYSYGHRNVQGLHYDAQTDRLWSHEHGPKGGDELNLIEPGLNYGWPVATFGIDYNGAKISPFTTYKGMTDSVHYWVPSIAASGMTVYRGAMFEGLDGDILVGGLASRDIRRLKMSEGRVTAQTRWLGDRGERIRDVQTAADGSIYVITDDKTDGKVLRLTPAK